MTESIISFICIIILFVVLIAVNFEKVDLKKKLCKYEIEYCSKEELLKRMEDK